MEIALELTPVDAISYFEIGVTTLDLEPIALDVAAFPLS